MHNKLYKEPKNSLTLFELDDHLNFLSELYLSNKLPKVLMLSGKKGIGKSTLVNHFLNFVYDKEKYNFKNKNINKDSYFNKQYTNNLFSNIIYLSANNFKNIKVEDIRNLKSQLLKTTILDKERFIVLDDIELFNINSLNALLKIIEEPSKNNYFILINNKTKSLIETIHSRSLELKILLTNKKRLKIIKKLIDQNQIEVLIDYATIDLTPGTFICFNDLLEVNEIKFEDDFLKNIEKILNLYKKNKDINLINLALLTTDFYFKSLKENKNSSLDTIIHQKSFVINNLNKFVTYNLNQQSLINALNDELYNG